MWEKRYSIVSPQRDVQNIRFYLESDVKLVQSICTISKSGIKISKISQMPIGQILKLGIELGDIYGPFESQLEVLLEAVVALDVTKVDKILNAIIERNGFEFTIHHVFYPIFDRLGTLWITGSISSVHEHFISTLVRKKTIFQIEQLSYKKQNTSKKAIVFLPVNDTQEVGLLFLHYVLKKRNIAILDLGFNTPIESVMDAKSRYMPDYIFTVLSGSFNDEPIIKLLSQAETTLADIKVYLIGNSENSSPRILPKNCILLPGLVDVQSLFDQQL